MTDFPLPLLNAGDHAPWFRGPTLDGRPDWGFNGAAGKPCLMFFMGTAREAVVADALATILARDELFDDEHARFFGITVSPEDAAAGRIAQRLPGIRYFLDYDQAISRLYRAAADGSPLYRPHILLLDARLQVVRRYALAEAAEAVADVAAGLPRERQQDWAPVLSVPDILEPDLCRALIELYDRNGGQDSGFTREIGGKTTIVSDHAFKRRRDAEIDSPDLRQALIDRISSRLCPAIARTFQFEATRIERYIVAAYDAADGGHFKPHRDNTTRGTAHRRFAVTINLNGDYEGGDLHFPEFGSRTYRAQPGGAVVFSCSLLHEATPMVKGRRYATLPFLYDDAAAEIRKANNAFLGENVPVYVGGTAA